MFEFKFPDVGEGITEGTIVKWKVQVGDIVKADQVIAEVETDKAVVEIPCPKAGKIAKINHKEGEVIKVEEVLAVIDDGSGSLIKAETKNEAKAETKKESSAKEPYTGSVVGFLEEAKGTSEKREEIHKEVKDRVLATLKVKKLAEKIGIDLTKVKGSGENGRILEEDLKTPAAAKPNDKPVSLSGDTIPLKGIRKTIADAMARSEAMTVAVTNFYDLDVTKLWDKRNKEKIAAEKKGIKLTFLAYFAKNVSETLKNHPLINSSIEGENIVLKKSYNIGIAVDTEQGLMVPVIKDADMKEVLLIAKEIADLAEKAKDRTIKPDDMRSGTFTISNLGSLGVKYFTPVINYPESAILGLGSIEDAARVENGKVVVKKIMPLSLTYDHRHIDGATASRFMNDLMKSFE